MLSTPTIRPSALPMLKDCAFFESGGTDFTESGTDRHSALAAYLRGELDEAVFLAGDDYDAVAWAGEYIELKANSGHEMFVEEKRQFRLKSGELIFEGTPDVVFANEGEGVEIFDLKWRMIDHIDYASQMAAYAVMCMIDFACFQSPVKVHLLYGAFKRAKVLEFDYGTASDLIWDIIQNVRQAKEPALCDHCGWCSRTLMCPAQRSMVAQVVDNREDWNLENYHASEIEKPEELAKALFIARAISKWAESVEYHAKNRVIKEGITIPGFKVQERKGKRYITDIGSAFETVQLPPKEFLACCSVTMGKLEEAYAEKEDISKAAGKREVANKLAHLIKEGNPSVSLVKERASK